LGEDRGDSRRKEKNAAIINTTDIYPQGVVVVEIPEKKIMVVIVVKTEMNIFNDGR